MALEDKRIQEKITKALSEAKDWKVLAQEEKIKEKLMDEGKMKEKLREKIPQFLIAIHEAIKKGDYSEARRGCNILINTLSPALLNVTCKSFKTGFTIPLSPFFEYIGDILNRMTIDDNQETDADIIVNLLNVIIAVLQLIGLGVPIIDYELTNN